MRKPKVNIIQDPENEVPVEVIATAITEISDGVKKMRAGRLNDKAIIFLISKASGVAKDTVQRVLNGMEGLEKEFLK